MPYRVEVLSHATQDGLIVFLVFFAILSVRVLIRKRKKRVSLSEQINEEYLRQHRKTAPDSSSAVVAKSHILPALFRVLWMSFAAGAVTAVVLAFTPLSYFPNFSGRYSSRTESVELKTLNTDFESHLMKIDGEVTNITDQALPELEIHLILYDQYSMPISVRTIHLKEALQPKQTMPFFFTEPKLGPVKRVGITFSSQFRPLIHRESAEVKQQP